MKPLIGSDGRDPGGGGRSILRGDINLSQLNITTLQKKYVTALQWKDRKPPAFIPYLLATANMK